MNAFLFIIDASPPRRYDFRTRPTSASSGEIPPHPPTKPMPIPTSQAEATIPPSFDEPWSAVDNHGNPIPTSNSPPNLSAHPLSSPSLPIPTLPSVNRSADSPSSPSQIPPLGSQDGRVLPVYKTDGKCGVRECGIARAYTRRRPIPRRVAMYAVKLFP